MNAAMQIRRPTPEEVEAMQRSALDLLESIIRARMEHVMGEEGMATLRQLVINPVRKDLRDGVDIDAAHRRTESSR